MSNDHPAGLEDTQASDRTMDMGEVDEVSPVRIDARLRGVVKGALFGDEASPENLVGRYKVVRHLGEGGMGVVYAAHDAELDREVALKVIRHNPSDADELSARLRREAQAMAKLSHPNVAHVYEVGEHDGAVFIALELIDGPTLRQWLAQAPRTPAQIVAMHVQAGAGLAAAHEVGIVHRDYKPDNVLVGRDGRPRVLDFGLARAPELKRGVVDVAALTGSYKDGATSQTLTRTSMRLGTPAYMASEQWSGGATDGRTDQFAFCVALFEALYGRRPFVGKTLVELASAVESGELARPEAIAGLDAEVVRAILKGLDPDPSQRHASVAELLERLRIGSMPRRRRWIPWAAVTALALGGGAVWLDTSRDDGVNTSPAVSTHSDPNAAILAASDLPQTLDEPLVGDPLGTTIHRLSNGLTVYIATRRDEPRIFAHIAVRAGSSDEDPDATGVAHLLEHMIHRGTDRLGTTDFAKERPLLEQRDALLAKLNVETDEAKKQALIAEIDAILQQTVAITIPYEHAEVLQEAGVVGQNAYTSTEVLNFFADVPVPALALWADLYAELIQRPAFRNFLPEFSVVSAEFRESQKPQKAVMARMLQELDPGPGGSTIGKIEHLSRFQLEAVRTFHRRWFVPNNTAIFLVGDIDAKAALPIIESAFGQWEPKALPSRNPETPMKVSGRHVTTSPGRVVDVAMGWRGPTPGSKGDVARKALLGLLDGPDGLLNDKSPGEHVLEFASAVTLGRAQRLGVMAIAAEGKTPQQAERAVLGILGGIAAGNVDEVDLQRVVADAEREAVVVADNNRAMGLRLVQGYVSGLPWRGIDADAEALRSLTPADVSQAARALIDGDYVVVHRTDEPLQPDELHAPELSPLDFEPGRRSAFATQLLARPRSRLEPRFLSEGRHYAVENVGSVTTISTDVDRGTFRLVLSRSIGKIEEPLLCLGLEAWVASADPQRSSEARKEALGILGARVQVLCGDWASAVIIDGLSRNRAEVLEILGPWLKQPGFDEAGALQAKESITRMMSTIASSRGGTEPALREYATWGEASRWRRRPSPKQLEAAKPAAIEEALSSYGGRRLSVLYAGPRDEELAASFARYGGEDPQPEGVGLRESARGPTVFVLDEPGREDAVVELILLGGSVANEQAVMVDLYNEYMSASFTGLLFEELRASTGFNYDMSVAHAFPTRPNEPAPVNLRIVSKAETAVETVQQGSALVMKPAEPTRFASAKEALEGRYRSERVAKSRIPSDVWRWRERGQDVDPRQAKWDALPRVTFEEFAEFIAQVAARPRLITIVADRKRLNDASLDSLGSVKFVRERDIFGYEPRKPTP